MALEKERPNFVEDDDGAVTVDWVILTAAAVSLALAALATTTQGTKSLTETISTEMANSTIKTTF